MYSYSHPEHVCDHLSIIAMNVVLLETQNWSSPGAICTRWNTHLGNIVTGENATLNALAQRWI